MIVFFIIAAAAALGIVYVIRHDRGDGDLARQNAAIDAYLNDRKERRAHNRTA
jgi:hypothetical protein